MLAQLSRVNLEGPRTATGAKNGRVAKVSALLAHTHQLGAAPGSSSLSFPTVQIPRADRTADSRSVLHDWLKRADRLPVCAAQPVDK